MKSWDIFVSHAREDKVNFVDPLAERLNELAIRVWYDKFILLPGDRLSEKIAEGLAKCRCGLIVISKSFIGKPWTSYELSGLINRFIEEGTKLIPIWLNVSRSDISKFNPALTDIFAIEGNPDNIEACALEILRVVRPQLHENITMLSNLGFTVKRTDSLLSEDIKEGPIRHHDLPESLLVRIQNVWFATRNIISSPLADMIIGFQRDLRPEVEVEVWERIVSAIYIAMDILQTNKIEIKKQVLKIILSFSAGGHEQVFKDTESGKLDKTITYAAGKAWLKAVPPVTIADVDETRA